MVKAQLWIGDAGDILDELADDQVDAIVTDPPAGISFQGHQWDHNKGGRGTWIDWLAGILGRARRVIKPGGHCLLWALPRSSHWSATALEDAGFEVRDVLTHLQGQGFPKSLQLDAGVGSALKPASEHWILARRRPEGSLTANFKKYGVGGLQIATSRIASNHPPKTEFKPGDTGRTAAPLKQKGGQVEKPDPAGRWPPNFLLSHSPDCTPVACVDWCPVSELDDQAGERFSGARRAGVRSGMGFNGASGDGGPAIAASSGYVSRFFPVFYVPKPSRQEREEGCSELAPKSAEELVSRKTGSAGINSPRAGTNRTASDVKNYHPTVKGVQLMTWLIKLITPEGGTVLDPFAGSGSTGVAAVGCGRSFIGIEESEGFALIAQARVNLALLRAGAEGQRSRR